MNSSNQAVPSILQILRKLAIDWFHYTIPPIERSRSGKKRLPLEPQELDRYHGHPFPKELYWVSRHTGFREEDISKAAKKGFKSGGKLVNELCRVNDCGLNVERWKHLWVDYPVIMREIWPDAFEPDAKQLQKGSPKPKGGGQLNPNHARDKWIYDRCIAREPYKAIRTKLNKKPKSWERIESDTGIRAAAVRYAERNGLPLPVARKGGRPVTKKRR